MSNTASIRRQEAVGGVRVGEGVFEVPEGAPHRMAPVPHYLYRVYRPGTRPLRRATSR